MTTLVVGANGLLGSNVISTLEQRGVARAGTYHSSKPNVEAPTYRYDLCEPDQIATILNQTDPDLVVNCAAMTDVDLCEETPEQAFTVNGKAPGTLARYCAEKDIALTYVSTDYVFDGQAETPYEIDSVPNPVQVYGQTKLTGERRVRENHPDPTIVRLSFVYGIHRNTDELMGFPAWVRDRLRDGQQTPLFTDQWITPTRAGQVASTILDLHDTGESGLFHAASRSCVTPFEFGTCIRKRMDAESDHLVQGSLEDIDRAATRPTYSCLDVRSVEEALGRKQPELEADLAAINSEFK